MIDAIGCTLKRFVVDPTDDVSKIEAEAAVALLIDLAEPSGIMKYVRFDGWYPASEAGVWSKAKQAIELLASDRKWLAQWNSPEKKAAILAKLLVELDTSEARQTGNQATGEGSTPAS
jgi:hypothetical protein